MDYKAIISKMSLEEKAELLTGFMSKTRGFEKYGISKVSMIDGPYGVRKAEAKADGGCVCFPTPSCMGATWNKELIYKTGEALGYECINEGYEMLLAPGVNMKRTPHCGRNFEYFSEDPLLSGMLAANEINGLKSKGIGSSLKHFALNNQEYQRTTINAEVDERTLREYYLKPFEIALENSDPVTVMCSYNKINGIWASENKFLLTDILREEWNYDGMVISDWGAVHDACKAIAAGLTLDMPCNNFIKEDIKKGIENGTITYRDVDKQVLYMLKFIDRIKSMKKEEHDYNREEQHNRAYDVAIEGITLLRNDDDVLPIRKGKYKKIGVFGKAAERPLIMGSGSSKVLVEDRMIDKPIDFIRKYAEEEGIELHYDPVYEDGFMGAEMVRDLNNYSNYSNDFDAMILFVSNNYGIDTETEHWDRDNLTFSNYMNGMIESACNACENVIVVMQTGSAPIPGRWHKNVKCIIQMWYSGEAGGKAISDILFAKANPSGKLSETFPIKERTDIDAFGDGKKTWYREGLFVGYRYYDEHPEEVWFPFGHGLSYTKFEYSNLKLSSCKSESDKFSFEVSVNVKNIGNIAGKETVQLYVSNPESIVLKPVKELKAFEKVTLDAGEEKTVNFTVTQKDFEYYNLNLKDWHTESGRYEILIGASSADIRSKASYEVKYDTDYTIKPHSTKFNMTEG